MLLEAVGSGSPAHPERSPHDASFYHRPPAPTVGSLPVLRGIEPGTINWGFYHSSVGKESACCAGDPGSIPGSRRSPGEGNGNPQQYSCLGNPMTEEPGRLHSMGRKESDMTEYTHAQHRKWKLIEQKALNNSYKNTGNVPKYCVLK